MMSLENILNEIASYEEVIDLDLDSVRPQVRPGFESRKRDAKDNLPLLKAKYEREALSHSIGFFVDGTPEQVKSFSEVSAEEGGTITVSASAMYERLAKPSHAAMGGSREFTAGDMSLLVNELKEVMRELDIHDIDSPSLTGLHVLHTFEDVVSFVRGMLLSTQGGSDGLNRKYVQKSMLDTALKARHANTALPVVVVGATTADKDNLAPLFTKSVVVSIPEEQVVDSEYVISCFELSSPKKSKKQK
jgi:hypothetical protein